MLPSNRQYAVVLTALRLYAGLFWLAYGIEKFTHPATFMPPSGLMATYLAQAVAHTSGPYHDFLVAFVLPHERIFAELVRSGEVLVGCALVLGIFTRFAGGVGMLLGLNYLASKGGMSSLADWTGIDGIAIVLSALCLLLPLGRPLGIDALLYALRPRRGAAPAASATTAPPVEAEFVEEPPLVEPAAPRD